MKAYVANSFEGVDSLVFENIERPKVKPDEVLVEVHYSSINPLDWKLSEGKMKLLSGISFPQIYGSDVIGTIVSKGRDIKGFNIGERVFGMTGDPASGAFCEYMRLKGGWFAKCPSQIKDASLGVIPLAGLTALQGIRLGRVGGGSKVLIIGASGGVGHIAVQIAKHIGAEVHAICSLKNTKLVTDWGADVVYAYDKGDHFGMRDKFDLVFDVVNSHKFSEIKSRLNPKGVYVGTVPSFTLVKAMLRSYFGTGPSAKLVLVKSNRKDLEELSELMSKGSITSHISQEFDLAHLKEALRLSKQGHVVGKLAIKVI